MNSNPFNSFIKLVNFDHHIRLCNQKIEILTQKLEDLSHQKEVLLQELEASRKQVMLMRKQVDEHELVMKEIEGQERSKKNQLEHFKSYKEYQSIKAELDHTHIEQQEQEQKVVDLWNKLDTTQDSFLRLQTTIEEKVTKIDELIAQKILFLEKSEEEKNSSLAQRPALEKMVPAVWIEKYTLMKSRVVDPVMPIEQHSCSACFYRLTGQDMSHAQQGALVQCKGCYRLLFLEEVHGSFIAPIT